MEMSKEVMANDSSHNCCPYKFCYLVLSNFFHIFFRISGLFGMFHTAPLPISLLLGVPAHLRGKEFIYRNANNLHVSEFQAFIKSHLVVRVLAFAFALSSQRLLLTNSCCIELI